jgi:hypothetical protein
MFNWHTAGTYVAFFLCLGPRQFNPTEGSIDKYCFNKQLSYLRAMAF